MRDVLLRCSLGARNRRVYWWAKAARTNRVRGGPRGPERPRGLPGACGAEFAVMLLFCPGCGNGLIVEEGQRCHRFACNTCPYVHNITRKVGPGAQRRAGPPPAGLPLPPPCSTPTRALTVDSFAVVATEAIVVLSTPKSERVRLGLGNPQLFSSVKWAHRADRALTPNPSASSFAFLISGKALFCPQKHQSLGGSPMLDMARLPRPLPIFSRSDFP